MKLRLASDLMLPLEVVTQTVLVVGKRGSGKSNTAARLVEQLHRAGCPFVVLDPVDNWWGLKASKDGRGPGLEGVYVFGGTHADQPLEPGGGELMADVLCEHHPSMILSVKHFTGGERSRFMTAFALRLLRKWSGGVLHVVMEEAHEFAPQFLPRGEQAEQMLGAFKRVWKLGRSAGIGGTAVTQRPASLSKDITTQAEILITHRTIGPQDVAAIKGWIRYHHESEETLGQLAQLKTGEAFVYAPEFPEARPIGLQRTTFLQRDTFDSTATPKPGERRIEPKALAPVDLKKIEKAMAATIERAKAEDPKELRRLIAERDRRIRELEKSGTPKQVTSVKQTPVLKETHAARLEKVSSDILTRLDTWLKSLPSEIGQIIVPLLRVSREITERVQKAERDGPGSARPLGTVTTIRRRGPFPTEATSQQSYLTGRTIIESTTLDGATIRVRAGARRMLEAVARRFPVATTVAQMSQLARVKITGGTFSTYLSDLRKAGYITEQGNFVELTVAGWDAIGQNPGTFAPQTTEDVLKLYEKVLRAGARRMVSVLMEHYPQSLAASELGELARVAFDGGTFSTYLSDLRRAGLVRVTDTGIAASELLMNPMGATS